MAPAHSRRGVQRRSCRRPDAAAPDDLSDLSELVAAAAKRLARELNDPAVDEEDLRQELLIRLHQGMPGHDPRLGDRLQFAKLLLKRQRISLIRRRYAEKRAASTVSWQNPIDSGDGETTLGALVAGDRRLAELGWACRNDADQSDLRHDVQTVVEKLDADDRRVADAVMNSESNSEAARTAGLARTTFNDRVQKLRSPFQQSGMEDFFE